MLKVLLRGRRWQACSTFIAEYDKAAGAVRSLPYADHCRVLEEMLPGCPVDRLAPVHRAGIHA